MKKRNLYHALTLLVTLLAMTLPGLFGHDGAWASEYQVEWTAPAQQRYFSSPYGVAVDGNGIVYVVDSKNNRIQMLSPTGTLLASWGNRGYGVGQFNNPHGVAVDGSGNVYVADTHNSRIQKLDVVSGSWTIVGSQGSGAGQFMWPHGVSVDGSGNVYVADSYNHRIQKLDAASGSWIIWGSEGSGAGQFEFPHGVTVDGSGNVYVADTFNNRIQKRDVASGSWSILGSISSGAGQFYYPQGVAVDGSGNVYVADTYSSQIQKYDAVSGSWSIRGSYGVGVGQFNYPGSVAVDGIGNVYVADSNNLRIQKSDVASGLWTIWGSSGNGNSVGQFFNPSGVTVDGSGNVYVADTYNNRIQKKDAISGLWTAWGGTGPATGQFNSPSGVAVDGGGNVYVADTYSHRIHKLDVASGSWRTWGSYGSGVGQFDHPFGVAVDGSDNVYVADTYNGRVQKLDVASGSWSILGSNGTGAGQGVAVDGSGNVYVADTYNNRIQKLDVASGTWIAWGSYDSTVGNFNSPSGVAVDGSGNVYVADTGNNRIQKRDAVSGSWSTWGSQGTDAGQFSGPTSVSVDGNGNVYVADTGNTRIQKFNLMHTLTANAVGTGQGTVFTGTRFEYYYPDTTTGSALVKNLTGGILIATGRAGYAVSWSGPCTGIYDSDPGYACVIDRMMGDTTVTATYYPVVSTTITVTSNVNLVTVGQTINFTATVSPSSATGTVNFWDRSTGTALGTATLSGGVAGISASFQMIGKHDIYVFYGGNAIYGRVTSSDSTVAVLGIVDNGNGTMTDTNSGLVWLKNANCTDTVGGITKSNGILDWTDAQSWSSALASGSCGLSDGSHAGEWRLPSIDELKSLYCRPGAPKWRYSCKDSMGGDGSPAQWLLPQGFSAVQAYLYWSSSTDPDYPDYAWGVNMDGGYESIFYKGSNHYVWPVRGGQWGDSVISGTVQDVATAAPVAYAAVAIGGTRIVQTDAAGAYRINIVPGVYPVTVSKNGYVTQSTSVTSTSGQTTAQNFILHQTGVATTIDNGNGTITDTSSGLV
jgi:DNA-binding beta-propeller fold protein YncE